MQTLWTLIRSLLPTCPRCGAVMQGGAPYGDWPVQYECPRCGAIVVPVK